MSRARDLADSADKDIAGTLTLDGLTVDELTYPSTDGTAGQVLKTDGAGNIGFSDAADLTAETRHSIRPSLLLDFANSKTLDPRIDFTRFSTATYYDGKTHAKAEENLLTNSEGQWWVGSYGSSTVTQNATTAPNGESTAELIYHTSNTAQTAIYSNVIVSGLVTLSCYLKSNNKTWGYIGVGIGGGAIYNAWFNLSAGTTGTVGSQLTSSSITDVGNGWYRCSVTSTNNDVRFVVGVSNSDGSLAFTSNSTDGVYFWGAQVEQRSSVTAYTPTTSQPITNYIPVLQTAASGTARFDHDPVTGESKGLLIEEQRTNLLPNSENFNAFSKTNITVTSNVIVSPDGNLTGSLVQQDTDTGEHNIQYAYTVTPGTTYTWSAYLKAQNNRYIRFQTGAAGGGAYIVIDTNDWSVTDSSTSPIYSITHIGNDWYRVTLTETAVSSAATGYRVALVDTNGSTTAYTGDGYSGVYIWGAQVEEGSFPTSYIPTSGSQVTRSRDDVIGNTDGWFSPREGSIYIESSQMNTGTDYNNMFAIYSTTDTVNHRLDVGRINNKSYFFGAQISGFNANTATKVACSYDLTNGYSSCAGSSVVSADSAPSSTATARQSYNKFVIGNGYYNREANGTYKKIAYYPTRLTNAELQALTEA